MGTEKEDFVQLTERIGRKTGGLSFSPFTAHKRGEVEPVAYLMVRGKVMGEKAGDMLDLMRDILLTARLNDKERFKQVGASMKGPYDCSCYNLSKKLGCQCKGYGQKQTLFGSTPVLTGSAHAADCYCLLSHCMQCIPASSASCA